jgi:sugar phosphate isomerase/epimerase
MNPVITRRELLAFGIGMTSFLGASRRSEATAVPDTQKAACQRSGKQRGAMKLSLSVRVAEKFNNKKESSLTIDQLIQLAKSHRYEALCMRASQAGIHTPAETVRQMQRKIRDAGLAVSMITGDFAVPQNDEHGPEGLRNIAPYLDLAEALQSNLIRICMKKEEDIAWAQRAADQAKERSIRLAHQSHHASLFETVEGSLDVLKKVRRPNFGLIYEPANWMLVEEPYGREVIQRLRDYIFNVYLQNHRVNPNAQSAVISWKKGRVGIDHIGLWERGGVRFEEVFLALHDIGYRGYVTVHQAFEGVMSVADAARRSAEYLHPLID